MAFDSGAARLHLASRVPEDASASGSKALVVRRQPAETWYKDQGGRKALLSTVIAAPFALDAAVPLRCRVLLETGVAPADSEGLLDIDGLSKTDLLALGPSTPEVEIRFRINKVSRNFDNTRFVLEVAPDYSSIVSPAAGKRLVAVRTFPILVKSKRRRPVPKAATAAADVSHRSSAHAVAAGHATAAAAPCPPALSGAPGTEDALRRLLVEQQRQSRMLATLLQNQAAIMGRLGMLPDAVHAAASSSADWHGADGPVAAPPTPPGPSSFRREGTDSSIGSSASDMTLRTAIPDMFHHSGRAGDADGLGVPASAGSGLALPSSSGSAGFDKLLAAAAAAESAGKRRRECV